MAKKSSQNEQKFLNGNYQMIPILALFCVIPFIMRLFIYDSGLEQFAWFPDRNQEADVFLYYRSIMFTVLAGVMAVVLGSSLYHEWKNKKRQPGIERIKQAKWLLPLSGFGLLALISTIFSEYRGYGLNGIFEQFESVWVVLGYCVVTAYVFYFVRNAEQVDMIQKALMFLLTVLGMIGILQVTGNDFFESSIGKSLYIPSQYADLREQLNFTFSGSGTHQVYLTFYNPNYVGVFAALILPVTVMLLVGNKDIKKKVIWGILSVTTFLSALGCGSRAFLLSLGVIAVVGIFFFVRKSKKYIALSLGGIAVFAAAIGIYINYAGLDLIQYVKSGLISQKNEYLVEDFVIEEDYVTMRYKGHTISMICEPDASGAPSFKAWDENGVEWENFADGNNVVYFRDERISDVSVKIYGGYDEYVYVGEVQADGHRYAFAKGNEGYTYMNYTYKADEIVNAEAAIFTDYDTFFGNRGYLWSRSIPLLKDYIILGSGADTFSIVFPQDDYVGRTNGGYQDQLITKPHSMYLQFGIQYGVVALLCFLAVLAIYVVQTLKICWKAEFKDVYSCLALGLLLGIIGYGIMGIANDSCVALAPIAWAILGLGFAVNAIVKEKQEAEEE